MNRENMSKVTRIGSAIYVIIAIFYLLARLFKSWGWTWLLGTITGAKGFFDGLFNFTLVFIIIGAIVYFAVAAIGAFAGKSQQMGRLTFIVGLIFFVWGLVLSIMGGGVLNIMKIVASLMYIAGGLYLSKEAA